MCKLFKSKPPLEWECPCEECMKEAPEDYKRYMAIADIIYKKTELHWQASLDLSLEIMKYEKNNR